jgi:hypothetical protein
VETLVCRLYPWQSDLWLVLAFSAGKYSWDVGGSRGVHLGLFVDAYGRGWGSHGLFP